MAERRAARRSSPVASVVAMAVVVVVGWLGLVGGCASTAPPAVLDQTVRFDSLVDLPAPDTTLPATLTEVLAQRRSTRAYADTPLSTAEVGQLFWAAQGITDDDGHRTAPSAGAKYPLELYALTSSDLLHYLPVGHRVESRSAPGIQSALVDRAFGQEFVGEAPAVFVIAGVVERTAEKYGAAAPDYVNREAGHAAQNLLLQAVGLDLVAVPVGGFDAVDVGALFALPPGQEVLYLIPIGHPA